MALPQRKLHRLKSWDYSQAGYYFVTVCTRNKRKLLAEIYGTDTEAVSIPTPFGEQVLACWERIEKIYPGVKLDYFCIMPNHLHGILVLEEDGISLSAIVRGFKSITTREYNKRVPIAEKNTLWQSSFYDEIIKNDEMLFDIRKYILGNPSKWMEDSMYIE